MEGPLEAQIRGHMWIEIERWGRIGIRMRELEKWGILKTSIESNACLSPSYS